jgi:PAS domain S-box-containing protein
MTTQNNMTEPEQFYLLSTGQLAQITNAITDPAILVDCYDEIVSVNSAAQSLLGYTEDELIKRPFSFILANQNNLQQTDEQTDQKSGNPTQIKQYKTKKDGLVTAVTTITPLNSGAEIAGTFIILLPHEPAHLQENEKLIHQNEIQTQSLLELSKALETARTHTEILRAASHIIKSTVGYQSSWIYLLSEDFNSIALVTIESALIKQVTEEFPILQIEGDPFLEEITEATHIVVVEDAQTDPRTNKEIVAQLGNRTIICIPITLSGKRLGVLGMGSFGDEGVMVPNQSQLNFLAAVGGHISVAVDRVNLIGELDQRANQLSILASENAQLFNTATRRAHELAVLMRLGQTISANLDLHTVLETTYQSIGLLMDNDAFWIATYEQNATHAQFLLRIDQGKHYATDRFSINSGIAGFVMRSGKPFLGDQRYMETELHHIQPLHFGKTTPVEAIICVPLLIGDRVIGAMSTQSYSKNVYSKSDMELLVKLAQPIAIALENARLFEAERAARDRIETLQAATQVLSTTLDLPQVFELILSELQRVIPYDSTSVQRLVEGQLEIIGGRGFPNLEELLGVRFILDGNSNPNREVMETRKPLILKDAPFLYRDFHTQPHAEAGIHSWLGVPLIFGDKLIGMIALDKKEADFYTEAHAKLAQAFAAQAASAIENAQLYDRLRDYAEQLERRVAERTSELEEANVRLKELDRLKSKFVSDVSHELRTPVTNLNLYLDLLERGSQDRYSHYLKVLREQAERLKDLIADILDLSRLDMTGPGIMTLEQIDLNDIVEKVVAVHKLRAEIAGLHLIFTPSKEVALVLGERNQLSQVITNLVVNAINYTSAGWIEVRTFLKPMEKQICLEVKDSGIGIVLEDIPHLFDRFYRGHFTSQLTIPGNGLGLAIVKEIVQKHDGRIEVESEEGQGTIFRVYFPRGDVDV